MRQLPPITSPVTPPIFRLETHDTIMATIKEEMSETMNFGTEKHNNGKVKSREIGTLIILNGKKSAPSPLSFAGFENARTKTIVCLPKMAEKKKSIGCEYESKL